MHCHLERKSKLSVLIQCSKRLIRHLHQPAEADGTSYAGFEAHLRQCRDARALSEGRHVHEAITRRGLERDKYLGNLLVEMYGKCGSVQDAFAAFERISRRNVYSWNIMLTAFAQNGHEQQAIELFWRMQVEGMKADSITFIVVLDACASLASLASGKRIHFCIVDGGEIDVGVSNALLNMYGKCGCLNEARNVFEGMCQRDVVSWTSMIAAYAHNGHRKEALEFFEKMGLEGEKPNYVTFISVLDACAGLEILEKGKLIHARIVEAGQESVVFLGNTIINMYGKCGDVSCARMVFERMEERSLVSWNAIISAYAQNGHGLEAFNLFQRLDLEGTKPDKVTFTSMLDACSSLTTSTHANAVHIRLAAAGYESDLVMANALINIYGKCGSLERAREVFDEMQCFRNVLSWSAMVAAYAQRGHGKEALELFTSMVLEGVTPNDVTFISVLCACSHAGLVEKGQNYFRSMSEDHGITAVAEHYGCMIDLFGRVGWLEEADAIANKAFQANPVAWITLLAACRIHGDLNRGAQAAERVLELDPKSQASYLLLSNMYTQ